MNYKCTNFYQNLSSICSIWVVQVLFGWNDLKQSINLNLPNTIFAQYTCILPSKNYAIKKYAVQITARFTPTNYSVLFSLSKLVFVALTSGTIWVDVPSPFVVLEWQICIASYSPFPSGFPDPYNSSVPFYCLARSRCSSSANKHNKFKAPRESTDTKRDRASFGTLQVITINSSFEACLMCYTCCFLKASVALPVRVPATFVANWFH